MTDDEITKLTSNQIAWLCAALDNEAKNNGWFEPRGRGWATCDALTNLGLLEHTGGRTAGERYRITPAGRAAILVIRQAKPPAGRIQNNVSSDPTRG